MKYAVILGDGMADWKIKELGNKTCLEAASTPCFDRLAPLSEIGFCKTVPEGFKPGSDVANMSVLGFDPKKYYTGRSPLEAVSMGINLKPTDVTLRCNLVTLSGEQTYENKVMLDYSAGEISSEEAIELINFLKQNLELGELKLYAGISYRHCLVSPNGKAGAILTPPHDISDKRICEYLPKGENCSAYLYLMQKSYELLSEHPVNIKRISEGKNPANSIWLWGEGTYPALDDFQKTHGIRGAIISAVDLVKGIAMLAGMKILPVNGITGNYDTNFSGKAHAAAQALKNGYDFVYIHMEAPDECGHHGDYLHKKYSVEQVDGVVNTLIKELNTAGEKFAILICPDHPTPCEIKTHTSDPVPYMIYSNARIAESGANRYTEDEAANTGLFIEEGHKLIERLFAIK